MAGPAVPSPRRATTTILVSIVMGFVGFYFGRISTVPPTPDSSFRAAGNAAPGTPRTASPNSTPAPNPAASSSSSDHRWDETQWKDLFSKIGTRARNGAMAEMLEALAASDAGRAMRLAQNENNLILREQLQQAVLRGWAKSAPDQAANWALALLNPGAREAALTAVFTGAVSTNPDDAVRLARSLIAQNPGQAVNYGGHVIDALCDAGNFNAAVKMAAGGDESSRSFWLGEAYSKWAALQPQQAAQAAAALEDSASRNLALHGVLGGWSQADPGSAVRFVLQLPADSENTSLLSQALERWTKVDLKAASDWIDDHEAGPAMDAGVASVATKEYLPPDVATGWAESVVNPKLRSETLVSVLRSWATSDLPAAKRYFDTSQNLLPDDRKEIAGLISTLSGTPPGE